MHVCTTLCFQVFACLEAGVFLPQGDQVCGGVRIATGGDDHGRGRLVRQELLDQLEAVAPVAAGDQDGAGNSHLRKFVKVQLGSVAEDWASGRRRKKIEAPWVAFGFGGLFPNPAIFTPWTCG